MDTQYTKKLEIDIRWTIPADMRLIDLQDQLDEDAFDRISEMMKEGYMCGELHTIVRDESEGNGVQLSGWWSLKG